MMIKSTIGFIGGGVMSEAIIKNLLAKKIFTSRQIWVNDLSTERLKRLETIYRIHRTKDKQKLINNSQTIVLAVKPQSTREVFSELANINLSDKLIISIMAGISIKQIVESLKSKAVIRAMPNLPVQIGEGVLVWIATSQTTKIHKIRAKTIFRALGKEVESKKESLIDAATAISGSGPAYMFYLLEILVDKAIELGFNQKQALTLAAHTMLGSAQLVEKSGLHPKLLRERVTSKGGTTEVALAILEKERFSEILKKAIQAAYQKAKNLSI